MSGVSKHIADTLRRCQKPLDKEVRSLARKLQRLLPQGYAFQTRGSFWSPYIRDVTDIDVIFFSKSRNAVTTSEACTLHKLAEQHLLCVQKFRVSVTPPGYHARRDQKVEEEFDSWDDCVRFMQRHGSEALQAVVVTGIFHSKDCNLVVPMDMSLSVDGTREESHHRLEKMRKKVQDGNYAKVLQKVRAMMRGDLTTRDELAREVNARVGPWRAASTQLQALQDVAGAVAHASWERIARRILPAGTGLSRPALAQMSNECDRQAQRGARSVLQEMRESIADAIGPHHRRTFLEITAAV